MPNPAAVRDLAYQSIFMLDGAPAGIGANLREIIQTSEVF
jgi:hypothetical protein